MPYILVAPQEPDEIGAIAARVYRRHYAGLINTARAPSLALQFEVFRGSRELQEKTDLFDERPAFLESLEIGEGLNAAHSRSLRHRDNKTQGIFVT